MVRTVLTAVRADLTKQRTALVQAVAMRLPAAVPEVRQADEKHVVQPGLLAHMVLPALLPHTVRLGLTVQQNLSVQQVLMDHLKRQAVDLQVAEPLVVQHV